jgi:hypothetical protein
VNLDPVPLEILEAAQIAEQPVDLHARLGEDPREDVGLLHRSLDREQAHEVGGLLDVVDDVVELRGERVEVGAVDALRRLDIEPAKDLLGDPIPLLLRLQDVARHAGVLGPGVEHALEELGPPQDVGARLREKVEIDRVPACQRPEGHPRPSYQRSRRATTCRSR